MVTRPLDRTHVLSFVASSCIGSYCLGYKGSVVPRYYGRSDYSLRVRLLQHLRAGRYDWFAVLPAESRREAFMLESRGWHLLRDSGLDNQMHPAAPAFELVRCSYCDFSDALDQRDKRRKRK